MTAPIVELRNVTKHYVGVTAIADLSLALHAGQVLCLLGENGAGKSTVIKILTGVETPTRGEVLVDGAPVHFASPRDARERGIATVYQEVGTLPLMSVARNFVLAAEPQKGRGLFRRLDLDEAARDRAEEPARSSASAASSTASSWSARCRAASGRRWRSAARCISARACWCSTSRPRRSACANRRPCSS